MEIDRGALTWEAMKLVPGEGVAAVVVRIALWGNFGVNCVLRAAKKWKRKLVSLESGKRNCHTQTQQPLPQVDEVLGIIGQGRLLY